MRTALLFGSSGLVGGHLLNQLIKDTNYSKIKLFVRSVPEISYPKVEIIKTDFSNLQKHKEDIKGDDCFVCIGTTKKNSADKDEYKRVELDIPKEIAKIAKSNLVNSFIFVSALYANPKGSGEYIRFKGLVEEELKELKHEIQQNNKENSQEELGDLLFSIVNLSRHLEIDASEAINQANHKFVKRFRLMEEEISKDNKEIDNLTSEELEEFWVKIKSHE